jgi:hypothetical protein
MKIAPEVTARVPRFAPCERWSARAVQRHLRAVGTAGAPLAPQKPVAARENLHGRSPSLGKPWMREGRCRCSMTAAARSRVMCGLLGRGWHYLTNRTRSPAVGATEMGPGRVKIAREARSSGRNGGFRGRRDSGSAESTSWPPAGTLRLPDPRNFNLGYAP